MKHYLRLRGISQEIEIINTELINLMNERDIIEAGTQIVYEWVDIRVIWEVIEIKNDKVIWQIKEVNF
jgi:hypothetical protein